MLIGTGLSIIFVIAFVILALSVYAIDDVTNPVAIWAVLIFFIFTFFIIRYNHEINVTRLINFEHKVEAYEDQLQKATDEREITLYKNFIEEKNRDIEFYKDHFSIKDWKAYASLKSEKQ